ncbi:MAG: NAD(P)/FAD-dependent oxidoreductase [Gammaproteobacteria bacterium]
MSGIARKHHKVIIIGAGGGGICMGVRLRQQGIEDFVMLDKAGGVGGTWYYNTYPGAECDVQSHLYSFSFEPKLDWSRPFAGQAEILAYMNHCVDKYGLRPHLRLNTGVARAAWHEEAGHWEVTTQTGDTLTADAVVSAIGMFNNIVWPDLPGIEDFEGTWFHSARWNHDYDLTGKRVGVVGIAASAVQFVPEIVDKVAHVTMYQRTANWVVPKPNAPYTQEQIDYFRAHPEAVQASREEIYETWNTLCTFNDKDVLAEIERQGLARIAEVNDPETQRKLTPTHPFGCKRPLFSDNYYWIFNRDNVDLVTTDIDHIGPHGAVTVDGECREVDCLIYSTGFETTTYLSAIEVTGRDGRSLDEAWADGAQAYLGITTTGFPNLFMLYGPNTNQGCILYMIEQQVDYVVRQLERMDREGLAWIDVRPEVMTRFNDDLQAALKAVDVWQASCGNDFYYRSKSGRMVTQWPHSMDAFNAATSQADAEAYEAARRASAG